MAMGKDHDWHPDLSHGGWQEQPHPGAAWPPRTPSNPPPPPEADVFEPGTPAKAEGYSSSGMNASTFLSYVSMGFGATMAIIVLGVLSWLLTRRAMRQRQQRVAVERDARRQRLESVQHMITQKRMYALQQRQPFLVVHPDGDAVVAFKERASKQQQRQQDQGPGGESSDLIKSVSSRDIAAYRQDAMSRRALVAAAALSGRTSSGISDILLAEAEAEAAEAGRLPGASQPEAPRPAGEQQGPQLHAVGSGAGVSWQENPTFAPSEPAPGAPGQPSGGMSNDGQR